MKKVIDIDDVLLDKLESFQEEYHIQTLSPVISFFITFGIKAFDKMTSPCVVAHLGEYPIFPANDLSNLLTGMDSTTYPWTTGSMSYDYYYTGGLNTGAIGILQPQDDGSWTTAH